MWLDEITQMEEILGTMVTKVNEVCLFSKISEVLSPGNAVECSMYTYRRYHVSWTSSLGVNLFGRKDYKQAGKLKIKVFEESEPKPHIKFKAEASNLDKKDLFGLSGKISWSSYFIIFEIPTC